MQTHGAPCLAPQGHAVGRADGQGICIVGIAVESTIDRDRPCRAGQRHIAIHHAAAQVEIALRGDVGRQLGFCCGDGRQGPDGADRPKVHGAGRSIEAQRVRSIQGAVERQPTEGAAEAGIPLEQQRAGPGLRALCDEVLRQVKRGAAGRQRTDIDAAEAQRAIGNDLGRAAGLQRDRPAEHVAAPAQRDAVGGGETAGGVDIDGGGRALGNAAAAADRQRLCIHAAQAQVALAGQPHRAALQGHAAAELILRVVQGDVAGNIERGRPACGVATALHQPPLTQRDSQRTAAVDAGTVERAAVDRHAAGGDGAVHDDVATPQAQCIRRLDGPPHVDVTAATGQRRRAGRVECALQVDVAHGGNAAAQLGGTRAGAGEAGQHAAAAHAAAHDGETVSIQGERPRRAIAVDSARQADGLVTGAGQCHVGPQDDVARQADCTAGGDVAVEHGAASAQGLQRGQRRCVAHRTAEGPGTRSIDRQRMRAIHGTAEGHRAARGTGQHPAAAQRHRAGVGLGTGTGHVAAQGDRTAAGRQTVHIERAQAEGSAAAQLQRPAAATDGAAELVAAVVEVEPGQAAIAARQPREGGRPGDDQGAVLGHIGGGAQLKVAIHLAPQPGDGIAVAVERSVARGVHGNGSLQSPGGLPDLLAAERDVVAVERRPQVEGIVADQ